MNLLNFYKIYKSLLIFTKFIFVKFTSLLISINLLKFL